MSGLADLEKREQIVATDLITVYNRTTVRLVVQMSIVNRINLHCRTMSDRTRVPGRDVLQSTGC